MIREIEQRNRVIVIFVSLRELSKDIDEYYLFIKIVARESIQIPKKYAEYINIFSKEEVTALLQNTYIQHRIKIKVEK